MRMRKKPNLVPRMERCSRVLVREPMKFRGKWLEVFKGYDDLSLELGCGKGSFTVGTARAHPNTLLVAIEKVPDAMVISMERACAIDLKNVLFINMDAAEISEIFAPNEVSRIFINFCDPWPSKKHAKRRLTSGNFLRHYKSILKKGGEIQFKTDNNNLFEYSLEQFEESGFIINEVTSDLHGAGVNGVMTDYEAKFHSLDIPICRCVAKLPQDQAQNRGYDTYKILPVCEFYSAGEIINT